MDERRVVRGNIAAYWDALSATYDDAPDHRLRGATERAAWLELLRGILPPAPAHALDLGTGFLALLLAELGYDVLGIDIAEGMIDVARRNDAGLPTPPRFAVGDAGAPEAEAGSVDLVVSRHLLWTLPDPLAALRNWHRARRPGGLLAIIDGLWSSAAATRAPDAPPAPPDAAYERYYTADVRAQRPFLAARTLDPVFALLAEAGFGHPRTPALDALARADHHLHPGSFVVTATTAR